MNVKPFAIEPLEPEAGSPSIMQVRITGYLDAHTVDAFEYSTHQLLELPCRKFILDMGELAYISSAGIGALMVFLQQLRRREGDMVIFQPTPKVFRILDLLGFTQIFTITQDYETARKALGA